MGQCLITRKGAIMPSTFLIASSLKFNQNYNGNNTCTSTMVINSNAYSYVGFKITTLPDYNSQAYVQVKNASGTVIKTMKTTGNFICAVPTNANFTLIVNSVHIGDNKYALLKKIVLGKTVEDVTNYLA